jgi:O-antigen/teichoic acid export membrane protein
MLAGISANALVQIGNVIIQLVSVPLFMSYWGKNLYGSWLIYFALPSLLALGDLGLTTAAGNEMIHAASSGRRDEAVEIFQSAWLSIGLGSIILIAVAWGIVVWTPGVLVEMGDASLAERAGMVMLIVAYSAASQHSAILLAGIRCDGRYALASLSFLFVSVSEFLAAILVLMAGGKGLAVALAYFLTRAANCFALSRVLARQLPWLRQSFASVRWSRVRLLLRPSVALIPMQIGLSGTLQGTTIILGALLSPAAVATFSTVRTASRLGVQAIDLVNNPLRNELSSAGGRELERRSQIVALNFIVVGAVVSALFVLMAAAGPDLIKFWTRGQINPDRSFVIALVLIAAVHGLWQSTSNLLMAQNKHESFSYFYMGLSLAYLVVCYALVTRYALNGAILANLGLEAGMLCLILWLVFVRKQLGHLELGHGLSRVIGDLRSHLELG